MSKRTSSMPSCSASWRVTSVLPTPVGPASRKQPIGFCVSPRPERAILIDAASASIASILAEHDHLQVAVEVLQHVAVGRRNLLGRDPRHARDDELDLRHVDDALALVFRHQALARAGLVDHVDRLVRQQPVADVLDRQVDRGLERLGGVFDLVVLLEARLQTVEDLDALGRRSARRCRSSGSDAPARDPSRTRRGIPGTWSSRCSAARPRRAPA